MNAFSVYLYCLQSYMDRGGGSAVFQAKEQRLKMTQGERLQGELSLFSFQ